MNLNDIFGNFPNRPDHSDFWRISSILLKLDARMEEAKSTGDQDKVWEDNVARWIDSDSLNYSAMQRAFRPLGVQTRGDLIKVQDKVIMLNVMWQEGFQIGAEFATEPSKGEALADLNETELRLLLSNYEKHVMEQARRGNEPLSVADFFNSFHSE